MIDLQRYKGLLVTVVGVLCAFVLINVVLLTTFGRDPAMFNDPDRQLAWTQLEKMGSRVAGVEQVMRRGNISDQSPFGVVLGQSTTLRGITPRILKKRVSPSRPWLVVTGFGSSFVKLHYYAQPLLASDLKPDTIVLGLHATMLAGQDRNNAAVDDKKTAARPDRTDGGWRLKRQFMQLIWVRTERKNISHHVNMALFETRLALHDQLGSGAVGLFAPAEAPWVSTIREQLPERRPDKFLQRQINGWREFGWYEPESYTTTNRHADAFRELIAGCASLEPDEIVIVLMPVSSDLRSWLPDEAQQAFRELVEEVSVGRSIRVLDMRDTMPDAYFADYAHLNPAGRPVFTRLLAERLSDENTGE